MGVVNLIPESLEKKDHSPVTEADFASQALVCAALRDTSRVKAVVGEEDLVIEIPKYTINMVSEHH